MRKPAMLLAFVMALVLYAVPTHAECEGACIRAYTQTLINQRIKLELDLHELQAERAALQQDLAKAKARITELEAKSKADQPKETK